MKKLSLLTILFSLLHFSGFSQCGYYAKIQDIIKKKVCNNIPYQQKTLSDLMYQMAVNCPDETSKFNQWSSTMKTDQDLKNYFCESGNSHNPNNSSTYSKSDAYSIQNIQNTLESTKNKSGIELIGSALKYLKKIIK